jgi:hypothetical protein
VLKTAKNHLAGVALPNRIEKAHAQGDRLTAKNLLR